MPVETVQVELRSTNKRQIFYKTSPNKKSIVNKVDLDFTHSLESTKQSPRNVNNKRRDR